MGHHGGLVGRVGDRHGHRLLRPGWRKRAARWHRSRWRRRRSPRRWSRWRRRRRRLWSRSKLTCCPTRGTVGDQSKLAVGEAAWTRPLAIRSEAATATGTSAFTVARGSRAGKRENMAERLFTLEGSYEVRLGRGGRWSVTDPSARESVDSGRKASVTRNFRSRQRPPEGPGTTNRGVMVPRHGGGPLRGTQAAFRGHRRGRDERSRSGGARAGGGGVRFGPGGLPLLRAPARRRHRAAGRPRRATARRGGARGVHRHRPGQPRAGARPRVRSPGPAPRRPSRRGHGAETHDRGGRHSRQDHHRVDGRAGAPRDRPRPRVPHRRRAPCRGHQRALGRGGVGGGGGGRVRPLLPEARARGGGGHGDRARSPRHLPLALRGGERLRRVRRARGPPGARPGHAA